MSYYNIIGGRGLTNQFTRYACSFGPQGSGANVRTPTTSSLTIGTTADFTIEFWFYLTAQGAVANFKTPLSMTTTGQVVLRFGGSANYDWTSGILTIPNASIGNVVLNKWYHYAISRASGTAYVHVNGIQYISQSNSINVNLSNALIGTYNNAPNQEMVGYLSQLCVSNVAKYALNSTFVPNLRLFPDSSTIFMTFDQSTFVDSGPNNFGALTVTNGTSAPTLSLQNIIRQ